MRKFAAAALLAALAAAPGACLDWNAGDPVAQARSESRVAALSAQSSSPRPGANVPGQFDAYVFSLEWAASFCEGKSSLPECSALSAGQFAASNLTLHGLWPDKNNDASHNYGFCGVDPKTQSLDRGATWCQMPAPGISDSVMSRLSGDMPGTASCLQNHEWYKHGSCSGYSPDDYFARAAELVETVAGTSFGRFLSSHVGQTVNADDLLAAFEADFGAGSRADVSLSCTNAHGTALLLDVRLRLSQPLLPASQLAQMLQSSSGGNCPSSFQIDPLP